jgi:DNA-3-methyladenine glycosylase II
VSASGKFELVPAGNFDLGKSIAFVASFPAAGADVADSERLRLAFTDDGGQAAAFEARQENGSVVVDYVSSLPREAVEAHVARILSLDVDATGFDELGRRDPVVAALQTDFPGLRPVCFGTPFEAAAWALMTQRSSHRQAYAVKTRLSQELGEPLLLHGREMRPFPAPQRLADLDAVPGLSRMKAERLRGFAEAALTGEFDARALRSLDPEEALARLQAIPGIGPFSAFLILVRGAGHPDVLGAPIRALRLAVADAYGIPETLLDDDRLQQLGEQWRPYRSWVLFLLRNRFNG